jgi:hypothetical protein
MCFVILVYSAIYKILLPSVIFYISWYYLGKQQGRLEETEQLPHIRNRPPNKIPQEDQECKVDAFILGSLKGLPTNDPNKYPLIFQPSPG